MTCRHSATRRPGFGHKHYGHRHGHFFGLDPEGMGPRAQVVTSLAVLVPVALSGVVLVALAPSLWWIFTTYFWVAFPAVGLLVRGMAGIEEARAQAPTVETKERQLLRALERNGELTPALAATETSLSVAEAEKLLKTLAADGHLEMRVRGGGIFYALWGVDEKVPELESR